MGVLLSRMHTRMRDCSVVWSVHVSIGGRASGSLDSGPIVWVVSTARFRTEFNELANASTLCGACKDICPVRIDIPTMLLTVRGRYVESGQAPAWLKVGIAGWAWAMGGTLRYRLAQRLAALGTWLLARQGR